jgi:hypothetical protein
MPSLNALPNEWLEQALEEVKIVSENGIGCKTP